MNDSALCVCCDRPKQDCPGEWEPGCDLGANEKHVVVVADRTPSEPAAPTEVACGDGCGARTMSDQVSHNGWSWLSIKGAWRCPECYRGLRAAAAIVGKNPEPFVDAVPKDSRGALPKETASTISAPSVRG